MTNKQSTREGEKPFDWEKEFVELINRTRIFRDDNWVTVDEKDIKRFISQQIASAEARVREETRNWAEKYLEEKDEHPEPSEVEWIIGDLLKFLSLDEERG